MIHLWLSLMLYLRLMNLIKVTASSSDCSMVKYFKFSIEVLLKKEKFYYKF